MSWGRQTGLPASLRDYVERRDSFYLATVSADGWPYVQHRGGAPGFLRVLDPLTLEFPDYSGNRQYVSVNNLRERARVALILMDYPARRRLKIRGDAELRELSVAAGEPGIERYIRVHISAWDLNCHRHITPRYTAAEIAAMGREGKS